MLNVDIYLLYPVTVDRSTYLLLALQSESGNWGLDSPLGSSLSVCRLAAIDCSIRVRLRRPPMTGIAYCQVAKRH
jgi:hypothetical protein